MNTVRFIRLFVISATFTLILMSLASSGWMMIELIIPDDSRSSSLDAPSFHTMLLSMYGSFYAVPIMVGVLLFEVVFRRFLYRKPVEPAPKRLTPIALSSGAGIVVALVTLAVIFG